MNGLKVIARFFNLCWDLTHTRARGRQVGYNWLTSTWLPLSSYQRATFTAACYFIENNSSGVLLQPL